MVHYIENDFLKVGVKEMGCELTSIVSKIDGYEFLWQGDESIWYGQSPILFPIVGRLINDKYRYNNIEYTMQKHGFARKMEWTLIENDGESMSFILSETPETIAIFPFEFNLIVTYTLIENSLRVNHAVVNANETNMYFSLGAHPGFNCKIGDKLVFDLNETLETEKIDLVKSLRLPDTYPVLNNEKEIVITKDIFNEDALILHGIKSENISLVHQDNKYNIRFNLGNAPYLGIWAKPGAPYVCIEPWFGVNDSTDVKNDISAKDAIIELPANEIFSFAWEAEFSL